MFFLKAETTAQQPKSIGRWQDLQSAAIAPVGPVLIFAQLILIALVLIALDIQTSGFRMAFCLASAGFLVHHCLPERWRLQFFVLLSVGGVVLVMGGSPYSFWDGTAAVSRALAILGIGSLLIAICHIPISFWNRAVLLVAAGCLIAALRTGGIFGFELAVVGPVLASMFMFRLAIYFYDISNMTERPPLVHSLAYFFLIPNVCFPFFPVIDFKTFCRSYYNEEAIAIYQRGVRRIVRGIVQLLIYRLVDQLWSLRAEDVADGADLIQFLVTNSCLYLKFSGQFHLIVGMLLLFGFNLPETNHHYFLASSFTDYWRRANIYWKDFILKVFYYPTVFKMRASGQILSVVVATLVAFFATWALHLYQTWWLKGSASASLPDTIFWSILGLLVLINSLWEIKRGRPRKLANSGLAPAEAAWLALRTAATFAIISLLWSLWSTSQLSTWINIWRYADWESLVWGTAVLGAVMIAKLVVEIGPSLRSAMPRQNATSMKMLQRHAYQCFVTLLAIYLVGSPVLPADIGSFGFGRFREALATGDSMLGNLVVKDRGYYEQLDHVNDKDRRLWETLMRQPIGYSYTGPDPARPVKDFRFREFIPNVHLRAYDTDFATNRWGMRDRGYDLAKSPGTFRIALLGSSNVMGWGVPQEDVFETILEARLNDDRPEDAWPARYEILNFASNGLGPLGQISVLQKRVRNFAPDMVIFVGHLIDPDWLNRDLPRCLREHVPIPYVELRNILTEAHVDGRTHEIIATRRLRPFEDELVNWSYREIANNIRAIGAAPIYVFLPLANEIPLKHQEQVSRLLTAAQEAQFTIIDLSHVYDGTKPSDLVLTTDSGVALGVKGHNNGAAHELIADVLYKRMSHIFTARLKRSIQTNTIKRAESARLSSTAWIRRSK